MEIKKTTLLVAELRVIAPTLMSEYCRNILMEAAERLEDTDKIAEYYRKQAEKPCVKTETKKRKAKATFRCKVRFYG